MRAIEIEENLQRKDFTTAEEVKAIKELHTLKQAQYGESMSGKEGGWGLDKTASIMGVQRSTVSEAIEMATAIEAFPELEAANSKSDIKKAMKAMFNIVKAKKAHEDADEFLASGKENEQVEMYCKDMADQIGEMESGSVDLLLTDPPYGIEIHNVALGLGGKTGGDLTTTSTDYDDSTKNMLELQAFLAMESSRVCKHDAHGFVFTAPEHFYTIRGFYEGAGWKCYVKPIIWVKGSSGQTNVPTHWPASCYETILYIRKDNARLVLEGRPDWIQCDPIRGKEKIHQAEKPVALLKELMSRVCLANSIVYDPFGGSGSTMQAAIELKMRGIYCELSKENYSLAAERIKQALK
jgi:site-specific DNA-methyltransferase (adenine-specific)